MVANLASCVCSNYIMLNVSYSVYESSTCLDRLVVVRTLRCGRNNPGSNPGLDRHVFLRFTRMDYIVQNIPGGECLASS